MKLGLVIRDLGGGDAEGVPGPGTALGLAGGDACATLSGGGGEAGGVVEVDFFDEKWTTDGSAGWTTRADPSPDPLPF